MNVTLRFPDGSSKEFPQGVTPFEVFKESVKSWQRRL